MKTIDDALVRVLKWANASPDPAPTAKSPGSDAGTLAREVCVQFTDDLKKYARFLEPDRKLLDGEKLTVEDLEQASPNQPPDKVTFVTLQGLAHRQPEAALARWEDVKAAAREDLANGWLAGRSVAKEAWERACFLAVREEFQAAWPPRNGVESMIIDEMAQYETLRRKLLAEMAERRWNVSQADGKEYLVPAAMMQAVDRLQRLLHCALRTLLGLRRSRSPVLVTHFNQAEPTKRQQGEILPVSSNEESRS